MQFPNIDDDDGDFGGSTTRSRLSSLFQTEKASGDVNQALTFTAPKQPKKNEISQNSQGTLKLIHASVVHAYKLIDGNYSKQGKLGCAILGLHETSIYKIFLYKGKQEKVSACNISPTFSFRVQPNNYATFYDERNENWSINFDTEAALIEFAKQVSLARANCLDKSQPSLIAQDLAQGEGPSLDIGDSAEVKYTGWLLTNFTFGQVFDTNMQSDSAFRLRLGKKVIKGWSEGLVGAQKGTRRLLIVPPHLAYGAEGMGTAVPPNSTLIFDLSVIKVKVSRDSSHSPSPLKVVDNPPEKKPEVVPRHSISSDENIRQRGASISEQLTQSPKKDKAQLISRMAKMGTATLPFQGAIAAQVESDSENEEEVQEIKNSPPVQPIGSRTSSPKPASRSASRHNSEHHIATPPVQHQPLLETNNYHGSPQPSPTPTVYYPQAVVPNQSPYNQMMPAAATPFPAFQPQITSQYHLSQAQYSMHGIPSIVPQMATSIADTHLPMLITETRSQNTEVRLSLSKITDKIDTVIQKVDDVRVNQGRSGLSHSTFMDSSMLVQTIEKIVQENSQLKEEAEAKNSKIQSLNEKIYDLLQRNQGFIEESNSMLEQKSDSLQAASAETQAKLLNLEKEKAKLLSELSDALRKLGSADVELATYQNNESELKLKLQEENKRIKDMENELCNLKKKLDSKSENSSSSDLLEEEIRMLTDERNNLKTGVKSWEEKYALLNSDFSEKIIELEHLRGQVEQNTGNAQALSNTENEKIESIEKELKEIRLEKDSALSKCTDMETKFSVSMKSESLLIEKVKSLETDLQNALPWKGKYENFYRKTLVMKEKYESELRKLETELKQSSAPSSDSPDFSGEIKKMMNVLYKLLQGKFDPASSYSGAQVLETTLQAIRTLTIQMLQRKGQRSETITKESNSVVTSENDSSSSKTDEEVVNKPASESDKPAGTVPQENGVAGDTSQPSSEEVVDEKSSSEPPDVQIIETKLKDVSTSESIEQPLQNNTEDKCEAPGESIVNKDVAKTEKEESDKSKIISQTRSSPDVWRPQPPPLFDDDSEEEDDDWLK